MLKKPNFFLESDAEIGHKLASIKGAEEEIGIFQLLRIPNIFMNIYCLFLLSIGWTFYEPSLAGHIASVSCYIKNEFKNNFYIKLIKIFFNSSSMQIPQRIPH